MEISIIMKYQIIIINVANIYLFGVRRVAWNRIQCTMLPVFYGSKNSQLMNSWESQCVFGAIVVVSN